MSEAFTSSDLDDDTPFHDGELAVQERMGVREAIAPWARRIVRPFMPAQHRDFYAGLPFMVIAARDALGNAWASLLAGAPGFISTPDDRTLAFAANVAAGDGLAGALTQGADIGLLGIQFADRRRNRVNGRVGRAVDGGLTVDVDQTFGNCPQYIAPRKWLPVRPVPSARSGKRLDAAQAAWINEADTFFIASGHRGTGDAPAFGMDASHRGGPAGFVSVEDEHTLAFPDYAGNNHFNTLGNLTKDPRVGLLFVDFAQGSMLQVSGTAEIEWETSNAIADGSRRVRIKIAQVIELAHVLPMQWHATGTATRALRVIAKEAESEDATSFYLAARDDGALPDFIAGQHLPLEVTPAEAGATLSRTYSLSSPPSASSSTGQKQYRISVKREPGGIVSKYLHDHVAVGDFLNAGTPAGDFTLKHSSRPVVLLSAGIGITPMISMLGALAGPSADSPSADGASADSQHNVRSVHFIHSARDGAHHAFANEVKTLGAERDHVRVHTTYTHPRAQDVEGLHYDTSARLNAGLLSTLLPGADVDCYLCGPASFLGEMTAALQSLGVPDTQIFSERFGA